MRFACVLGVCLLPALAAAQPVQPVQVLHRFVSSPSMPTGALTQVPDGSFFGVTSDAIYRRAVDGTVSIAARLTDGIGADGPLVRTADGFLYGTTQWGGASGQGTVFRFDPATGAVQTIHTFTGPHEGTSPFDGLTLAGGQLYGVTGTTLFRLEPATGALTILHTFGPTGEISATGGRLTAGADGLLYGIAGGSIYRLDPATGAVAVVHELAGDYIEPEGHLALGLDGRLYGSALRDRSRPQFAIDPGGIFRYDPATDVFEELAKTGFAPSSALGPLMMTPDGSLYGTTRVPQGDANTLLNLVFRLRPSGGGHVYEAVHVFSLATTGLSHRVQLTGAADGLLYGYAQTGGPAGAGTIYRFDPAGAGPMPNNIAFTVLHQFSPTTTWAPSAPAELNATHLYGTTSLGGAAQRGAIYDLNPSTGAVSIVADIPGSPAQPGSLNSTLTHGPDSVFYGTTAARTAAGAIENGVVRFVPASNATTNPIHGAIAASVPSSDAPMVRRPGGDLYFVRARNVYRVHPDGSVTLAGSAPLPAGVTPTHTVSTTATAPAVGGDSRIYVGMATQIYGAAPFEFYRSTDVFAVNPVTDAVEPVASLSHEFQVSALSSAPGGLYLAASQDGIAGSAVRYLNAATGEHVPLCAWPDRGLASLTSIADRLVGVTISADQKLLVCDATTGVAEARVLPASIGMVRGPLVAIDGLLYGATLDRPVSGFRGFPQLAPLQPGGALIRFTLSGTPPALDTEADGLPNLWETTYGLDPFDATGANGASGDPDGDGRTNAQELADGTHPRGTLTRYFAEGATGPFFRTRFDLANPNAGRAANVLVRFLSDTGARIAHHVVVPPASHESIDPATIPGLAHATFSTVVEADLPLGVDRTMSWDASGYGSHIETGVVAPSTTWYLAEGSTSGPFALFYLLQNPQATAVTATVRYLRPFGLPPIDRTYTLPPNSRTTIVVDDQDAELASTDVSAVITAPSPIVAERAMYYSSPGQVFAAGHESAGVAAPALEWFLAEGATGAFFDLFVLIANPNPSAAAVDVEYLLIGGGTLTKSYSVPGNSRLTIWVDDEQLPAGSGTRPLANAALSMVVRSTNAVPIVVERTMWWPGPSLTPNYWYETHSSPGSTTTATRWVVAGGEVGGADGAQTYVLIANPGTSSARVRVTTLTDAGPTATPMLLTLPAKSRTNVALGPLFTQTGVSCVVESEGTVPVPIVVERATYSSPGGVTWAAGGNALAAPLP